MAELVLDQERRSTGTSDLTEDMQAAWVPDVGGWVDLDGLLRSSWLGGNPVSQRLKVPKVGGGAMDIAVLHPGWHAALHRATTEIRDPIEQALHPAVFGYRYGASATAKYARLWHQFRDYSRRMTMQSAHVVNADVSNFFFSLNWDRVIKSVRRITGQPSKKLELLIEPLTLGGLAHPPSGYADARLLANAVLHQVDQELSVPFSRWVDDYRLFIPRNQDPKREIERLRVALLDVGLRLNEQKTRVLSAAEAADANANTLASVFHPERESDDQVHESLKAVFDGASQDPVGRRRDLRFVLPRLAKQNDDTALDFALGALEKNPWEAPRLVSYISVFRERRHVASSVDAIFRRCIDSGSVWLTARVGALACSTGISRSTGALLGERLEQFAGTPAWGMGLRALSLNGWGAQVQQVLKRGATDKRAALIALRDLNVSLERSLEEEEPLTAEALNTGPAPRPPLEAIL
jgi:hypothetical protein